MHPTRLPDGRVRAEIAGAWKDTDKARTELPGLLDRIKPQVMAWYPSGPAGALASVLKARPGNIELTGHAVAQARMSPEFLVKAVVASLVEQVQVLFADKSSVSGKTCGKKSGRFAHDAARRSKASLLMG